MRLNPINIHRILSR